MLSNIGIPGVILIVLFALIVFGPKKLPELGRSMGRSLKEFKSATKGITGDDDERSPDTVNMTAHTETTGTPVEHKKAVSEIATDKV